MTKRTAQDPTDRYALRKNAERRRRAAAGRKPGLVALLLIMIVLELLIVGVRLALLVRRVRTRVRLVARRRAASRRPTGKPRVPRDLPERFAWLLQMVPVSGVKNEALYRLMARPEMGALVARAPKIRRGWPPIGRGPGIGVFAAFCVASMLVAA